MEVASPLTLSHAAAGTKRSLVYSPGLMDTTNRNPFGAVGMDMTDDNMPRAFKRRRFQDATMENTEAASAFPPFMNTGLAGRSKSVFAGNASLKRCRQDALAIAPAQNQQDLERVVETQASEIEYLKTAKANLETSLAELKTEHDKTLSENKILKRAVTIQQERQTQASNHLEQARQYKVGAEENIRRLEQMIVQLRYHLQAQQVPQNDFMGFPPNPPNVF